MSRETFESLRVWHESREFVAKIYACTRESAFATDFGLRDQIRRAALSVMSNIAEGHERGGSREFARFLTMAKGSCAEVRSQLYAAEDVGYLDEATAAQLRAQSARLSRRLQSLAASRANSAH